MLLIWARRQESAYRAGMRYLLVQLLSGLFLLVGGLMVWRETACSSSARSAASSTGGALVLVAFGIKCAFPSCTTGCRTPIRRRRRPAPSSSRPSPPTRRLCAGARLPGTELLIWVGTAMAAFPIFYAVIENDLRRVLAYSMNNRSAFMVVGVGIGTELAVNGAVAHAFADILFKALLFMSMGAVLLRTGTVKGSELGGLYKSMPWTTGFCIVGAASISAFPLVQRFRHQVDDHERGAHEGLQLTWLVLLFASAGRLPPRRDQDSVLRLLLARLGIRCEEAPKNMLVAMAITAALCIGIGVFPMRSTACCPLPSTTSPAPRRTSSRSCNCSSSALAFSVLMRTGIYPPELRSEHRQRLVLPQGGAGDWPAVARLWNAFSGSLAALLAGRSGCSAHFIARHRQSDGAFVRSWATRGMAMGDGHAARLSRRLLPGQVRRRWAFPAKPSLLERRLRSSCSLAAHRRHPAQSGA